MADTLRKVREAAELGELDALIETASTVWQTSDTEEQVNKRTEERVWIKHVLRLTLCKC